MTEKLRIAISEVPRPRCSFGGADADPVPSMRPPHGLDASEHVLGAVDPRNPTQVSATGYVTEKLRIAISEVTTTALLVRGVRGGRHGSRCQYATTPILMAAV